MPNPLPLPEIIPIIIKLFPGVRTLPLIRGLAIPLNNVTPSSDEDLARDLARQIQVPQNNTGIKDSSNVIKVDQAIECVTTHFNDTTLILEFLKVAAASLVRGQTTRACGQVMAEKMINCLRENALRQDTPRTTNPPRQRYHRPAVGHGEGRGGFE